MVGLVLPTMVQCHWLLGKTYSFHTQCVHSPLVSQPQVESATGSLNTMPKVVSFKFWNAHLSTAHKLACSLCISIALVLRHLCHSCDFGVGLVMVKTHKYDQLHHTYPWSIVRSLVVPSHGLLVYPKWVRTDNYLASTLIHVEMVHVEPTAVE